MKRRQFMQNTLAASLPLAIANPNTTLTPPKKGFKVSALAHRQPEKIAYGQIPIDFKLLSSDTENQLSVFISTNNTIGNGPPLHVHHTFDEFFCILDGEFAFMLDDEQFSLQPGDTIFIPRNVRHTFGCMSQKPGSLLVNILPGKGMETFFAEMGKLMPAAGPPDLAAMRALYRRFDSEILGPPMGAK